RGRQTTTSTFTRYSTGTPEFGTNGRGIKMGPNRQTLLAGKSPQISETRVGASNFSRPFPSLHLRTTVMASPAVRMKSRLGFMEHMRLWRRYSLGRTDRT